MDRFLQRLQSCLRGLPFRVLLATWFLGCGSFPVRADEPAGAESADSPCAKHKPAVERLARERQFIDREFPEGDARPEIQEQRRTSLAKLAKEVETLRVQRVACGCLKGRIDDLPPPETKTQAEAVPAGNVGDGFWTGTWTAEAADLELKPWWATHTWDNSWMQVDQLKFYSHTWGAPILRGVANPLATPLYFGDLTWKGRENVSGGFPWGPWKARFIAAEQPDGSLTGTFSMLAAEVEKVSPAERCWGTVTMKRKGGAEFEGSFRRLNLSGQENLPKPIDGAQAKSADYERIRKYWSFPDELSTGRENDWPWNKWPSQWQEGYEVPWTGSKASVDP